MSVRLADVYAGLAALLRAGFVTGQALGQLRDNGTLPASLAGPVQQVVSGGRPLSEALRRFPDEFPDEDVAVLEAGEATGRVDETLERLARLHQARAEARRALLLRSLYPIFLVHFASFVLPIANLASKGKFTAGAWLVEILKVLGPLYVLFFLVRYLNGFAGWRRRFRQVVDRVPGFGAAARHERRARFASVLEAAYEAGMPVSRALELAGRAAETPRAAGAAQAVAQGRPLAAALTEAALLPPPALSQVATAEEAGEISAALRRIGADEASRAAGLSDASMKGLGIVVAVVVMGWIAWSVISFYWGLYAPFLTK